MEYTALDEIMRLNERTHAVRLTGTNGEVICFDVPVSEIRNVIKQLQEILGEKE